MLRRVLFAAGVVCLVTGARVPDTFAQGAPPFVSMWGSYGTAPGQFRGPSGIAVDPSGNVFVVQVDNTYRAQKFTGSGSYLLLWGGNGSGQGQFDFPNDVAVDGQGNVYIADTLNDRIQKFTSTGSFILAWGSFGTGNGQFDLPYGVTVDGSGNVFVADQRNHRIQKFSSSGSFLAKWGSLGTGNGQFDKPVGISADPAGNIFVCDTNNNRVQKFSNTGTYLGKFGSTGSGNGQFNKPGDIAFDGDGNIYVTDTNNHRVQRFSSGLAFQLSWGGFGFSAGQFLSPTGLDIGASGYVYVVDGGNQRIQRFGPVTPPSGGGGQDPNTPIGTNVAVALSPATLVYDQVLNAGMSNLTMLSEGPAPPTGMQVVPKGPPIYYELVTTAGYTGAINISIQYDPADVEGAEADLRLYHYDESTSPPTWQDITTQVKTGPNVIEGRTPSLSTFIVAEAGSQTGIADLLQEGTGVRLAASFPNPFRAQTRVRFELPTAETVRAGVFDLHGRKVRTLVSGEVLDAGLHDLTWDSRGDDGGRQSPGIYFIRLETSRDSMSRKVLLID